MKNKIFRMSGLIALLLLASQIGGCSSSGARPSYHMSASAPQYWGGYGYRRVGYYGAYGHRSIGRPYYGGGYRRGYRRY